MQPSLPKLRFPQLFSTHTILATIKGVANEVLARAFKNGLKEEVRAELRLQRSSTLLEMMEMAQQVEERNVVVDQIKKLNG